MKPQIYEPNDDQYLLSRRRLISCYLPQIFAAVVSKPTWESTTDERLCRNSV